MDASNSSQLLSVPPAQMYSPLTQLLQTPQEEYSPSNPNSLVDYSVNDNRLKQHADGSIELIPKTVGEVLGESLLRPLINSVSYVGNKGISFLKEGTIRLDAAIGKVFHVFPGASAQLISPTTNANYHCYDFVTYYVNLSAEQQADFKKINPSFADYYAEAQLISPN